ncbi:hypothetical protein CASFOL_004659 [Castilleja foliolosa]|uniref:Uncharacterized protein n=1 Tax=Castilleja foliolosa TaxID=1961234 RepID=A0ABD3EBJ6_9LAMI
MYSGSSKRRRCWRKRRRDGRRRLSKSGFKTMLQLGLGGGLGPNHTLRGPMNPIVCIT